MDEALIWLRLMLVVGSVVKWCMRECGVGEMLSDVFWSVVSGMCVVSSVVLGGALFYVGS